MLAGRLLKIALASLRDGRGRDSTPGCRQLAADCCPAHRMDTASCASVARSAPASATLALAAWLLRIEEFRQAVDRVVSRLRASARLTRQSLGAAVDSLA